MTSTQTSQFVRLRVELVVEIGDPATVTGAALQRIAEEASARADDMSLSERTHAEDAVREDASEALAYLVDPLDLLGELEGVELAQASWSSEHIEYDPDSPEWEPDEDDVDDHVRAGVPGEAGDR